MGERGDWGRVWGIGEKGSCGGGGIALGIEGVGWGCICV